MMSTPARTVHTQSVESGVQPCPRPVAHHRSGYLPAEQDHVQVGMLLGDLGRRLDARQPAAGHHDGAVGQPVKCSASSTASWALFSV